MPWASRSKRLDPCETNHDDDRPVRQVTADHHGLPRTSPSAHRVETRATEDAVPRSRGGVLLLYRQMPTEARAATGPTAYCSASSPSTPPATTSLPADHPVPACRRRTPGPTVRASGRPGLLGHDGAEGMGFEPTMGVTPSRFSSLIRGLPDPTPIDHLRRSRPESFRPLTPPKSRCVPVLRARSGHGRRGPGRFPAVTAAGVARCRQMGTGSSVPAVRPHRQTHCRSPVRAWESATRRLQHSGRVMRLRRHEDRWGVTARCGRSVL